MKVEELSNKNKIVMKRVLNASPAKLYEAWTDARLMAKWFRPNERWVSCHVETNPVVGGNYKIVMTHQDGDVFTTTGHYLELIPNTRFSATWVWEDDPNGRSESTLTVSFAEVENGTELTLVHENLENAEGTTEGWLGCLESFSTFVAAELANGASN